MTSTAFFLILASVLLHASYHFITKASHPKMAYFCLYSLGIMILDLPFPFLSGLRVSSLPCQVLLCAAGGSFFGAVANIGLSWAYRTTDISVSYPLARALPVILTMLITGLFGFGKALSGITVTGMIIIFFGCLMTGITVLNKNTVKAVVTKGIFGILIAALSTTGYTIIDSFGIQSITKATAGLHPILSAGTYAFIRDVGGVFFMFLFTLSVPQWRRGFDKNLFHSWHQYIASFGAAIAYLLVLLSMEYVTNVSYVQAFRQMSLPVAALLGFLFLKEKISWKRLTGIALILIGLYIIIL